MPVTLKLTFPAGRYHATPWGRHVNEGVTEWPPSPWRLLRALVAVWRRTCPDLPEQEVRRVLEQLVRPPVFRLPQSGAAHTRHYMPLNRKSPRELSGGGTTLVFDAFVAVGRDNPVLVHWEGADLAPSDAAILERLAANLTTLGRAESWVEAALVDWDEAVRKYDVQADRLCRPEPASIDDETWDREGSIPVLCPKPDSVLGDEYYPSLPDAKKRKQGVRPDDLLFDCPRWHLCLDTQTIHDRRWPRVPGAEWINYVRPLERTAVRARGRRHPRSIPTVARFVLDGPVLPLVIDTVRIAEAFRGAAMSRFQAWCRRQGDPGAVQQYRRTKSPDEFSSPILSGKDRHDVVLQSHGHAYYLPSAGVEHGPRRISHVTVCAQDGFNADEVEALMAIRQLKMRIGGNQPLVLRVQLVGLGQPADFRAVLFGPSRVWQSVTPFVGPDHIGRLSQDRYLLKAARREARRWAEDRGVPMPMVDQDKDPNPGIERPHPLDFRRSRTRDGSEGYQRPCGLFRLRFEEEVTGPICLGYASHFGLGLFVPETYDEVE